MGSKILIVEDHFIEANDLRIILEKAGHTVCGIAASVEKALLFVQEKKPEIVLVDIFLQGNLTGIDLAKKLGKDNIPFIFLSANSNESTLEAAKATQPYGFLVKPFREKDILVALDIASYRHKHNIELMQRHQQWLGNLLLSIIEDTAGQEQKLILLVKAFQPFIHYDYMVINTTFKDDTINTIFGFKRVDYNDYSAIGNLELLKSETIMISEKLNSETCLLRTKDVVILDEVQFEKSCLHDKLNNNFKDVYGIRSCLWMPFIANGIIDMSICFYSCETDYFNNDGVELLTLIRPLLSKVLENIRKESLTEHVVIDFADPFKEEEIMQINFPGIIGNSSQLLHVMDQVRQAAPFDTTILILGETGTGKEGLVDAIHRISPRKTRPLIKVHCAAIPADLIESELFGHERGAFTGATERKIGKFEQAQGGTIFLDEIGEIPLKVQSKLLRVLQEKEIERIGGKSTIKVDVRIVAATNRNLHKEVAEGNFRMDLYYRINVFPIILPPLRDRITDIPLLVDHFLKQYTFLGTAPKTITKAVLNKLMDYSWPGNIRELQHLMERSVLITKSAVISSVDLQEPELTVQKEIANLPVYQTIEEVERKHILAVINSCGGKINGKGGAAEILKLPPTTLSLKMKKLGIVWQHIFK